jgi:hypothetical protein
MRYRYTEELSAGLQEDESKLDLRGVIAKRSLENYKWSIDISSLFPKYAIREPR